MTLSQERTRGRGEELQACVASSSSALPSSARIQLLRRADAWSGQRQWCRRILRVVRSGSALFAELLCHRGARIRRRMLNIGPVDITAGKFKIGFDRLASVIRDCRRSIRPLRNICCGAGSRLPSGSRCPFSAVITSSVLGRGAQKFEIAFENVLDPEKDVAESGTLHQRSRGFLRDWRSMRSSPARSSRDCSSPRR